MDLVTATLIALASTAGAAQDVERAPSCQHCGMDRAKFAHSRMVVEYEDGTTVGTCSLHCTAVELAQVIDRTPKRILVGDHDTRELIDAERASWVLGGGERGVMTSRAKWAFRDRAAAEAFVARHGGTVATFEDAMKAAYEDMYQDTKAIRERRSLMKKGGAPAPKP